MPRPKSLKHKSVEAFAPWFKLNNYSAARELDYRGWFLQLELRRSLYKLNPLILSHIGGLPHWLLMSIQANPICSDNVLRRAFSSFLNSEPEALLKDKNGFLEVSGVQPLSLIQFLNLSNILETSLSKLRKYFESAKHLFYPLNRRVPSPLTG